MKGSTKEKKRKKHQKAVQRRALRQARRRKRLRHLYRPSRYVQQKDLFETAPKDFRFGENTAVCADFFEKVRKGIVGVKGRNGTVHLNFANVMYIDFLSVVVFRAILREARYLNSMIKGNAPDDASCLQFMLDSNFFEGVFVYRQGRRMPRKESSLNLIMEQGKGKLTGEQIRNLRLMLKECYTHIDAGALQNTTLLSGLKEICGNAIDWSRAPFDMFWTIGVKKEVRRVVFVALDLGVGILKTLKRQGSKVFWDALKMKRNTDVLSAAFAGEYISASKDGARNLGLPKIKSLTAGNIVKNLQVITNDVRLNFEDDSKSMIIESQSFRGTLYSWYIDTECEYKRQVI